MSVLLICCPRFYTGRAKHAKKIFFVKPNVKTDFWKIPANARLGCGVKTKKWRHFRDEHRRQNDLLEIDYGG
jgi:hypothetical protein